MKLITLLASSAALAGIALVVPATVSPDFSVFTSAEAANVSVDISLFYNGLDRHGDWVDHDGDYVFVPAVSDRNWRPYREGHWVYARGYGWTWVSTEAFGWATYHYGRWGFDREIGWYWVPGTRWAPAWVSWRRSGNHVAWAPLPPHRHGQRHNDVNISISFGDIPDYYWVAVPTRHFLDRDLTVVVIRDERERREIVQNTEFVGTVNIENNIVINNVINVNYIEENTGRKVKEVAVKETSDPATAKSSDEEVAVFKGTVAEETSAKPAKLKDVSEVKKNQAEVKQQVETDAGGKIEDDTAVDQTATPDATKKPKPEAAQGGVTTEAPVVDEAATPVDKKAKKLKPEEAEKKADEAPAVDQAEQPVDKKAQKVKPAQAEDQTTTDQPAADEAATPVDKKAKKVKPEQAEKKAEEPPAVDQADQPVDKKAKKVKPEQAEKKADEAPVVDRAEQPADKKTKKQKPAQAEDQTTTDQPATQETEQPVDKKAGKKNKKAEPCDPAADPATQEGCEAQ